MDKISLIYSFIARFKYIVTFCIGILIVGVLDSNSIYQRLKLQYQIIDLENEISKYNKVYKHESEQLRQLERNPKNIERIARERYFMKANDEDIYVLSTDQPDAMNTTMPNDEKDEADN